MRQIPITQEEAETLRSGEPFENSIERDGALIRYVPDAGIAMRWAVENPEKDYYTDEEREEYDTPVLRDVDFEVMQSGDTAPFGDLGLEITLEDE